MVRRKASSGRPLVICQKRLTITGHPRRARNHTAANPSLRRTFPRLARIVELFDELLPAAHPVHVRRCRIAASMDGDCRRTRARFVIRISASLREDVALDALVHEWAHALAWNHLHDRLPDRVALSDADIERLYHGPEWGVAYSRVYTTLVGEVLPRLSAERREARRVASKECNR